MLLLTVVLLLPLNGVCAHSQRYDTLRVKLTNLKAETRLHIGVYGNFLVDGHLSFQRGSEIEASLENGLIWLYHEGLCYQAGREVRFVRHQADAKLENGLRLQHGLNLYEGDLVLAVRDGKIDPVLYIGTEDYLKGVVPYEMNDSFPLEALKAQAVAARTYALSRLGSRNEYDLLDNTNDQVYKGFDKANRNAQRAILTTQGQCGVYAGKLATLYYTASNGGQTMSRQKAWAKQDLPYLCVREDPFDLENPESPVKTAALNKLPHNGIVGNQEFTRILLEKIKPSLRALGCNTADGSFSIHEVVGAALIMGDDNRPALQLDVRLTAQKPAESKKDKEVSLFSSPKPANTPAPQSTPLYLPTAPLSEKITVSVPIFPEAEQALQLSINKQENETMSVKETKEAFILSFRRYGHGVGMSQRGAQQMAAKHGYSYQQILSFYYPGTELNKYETVGVLPAAMPVEYLSTPGPVPTATPRPTLMPLTARPLKGQWLVSVTGIARNSSLNLRSLPDTSGEVLKQLYYGQKLLVLKQAKEGWLHVKTDDAEGYVMEKFVQIVVDQ